MFHSDVPIWVLADWKRFRTSSLWPFGCAAGEGDDQLVTGIAVEADSVSALVVPPGVNAYRNTDADDAALSR